MLKPLYHSFENDYIDFWSLLDVSVGADPEHIFHQYVKHLKNVNFNEKIDEFYVGYKLLRDKNFEKVYLDTKSLKKTYDAGFFLDSMEITSYYDLNESSHMPVIPMHNISFSDNKPNILLVSTGGFSPVHEGHLHTLEIAKKNMEEKGFHVVGGYLSPSHDHYVSSKDNGNAHNPALNRIHLCNQAIKDSEWLMTSPYESLYTSTSVNYTDALLAIKNQIQRTFKKDFVVGYVFGGDNAPFIRAFQDDDIAICVSRESERESIFDEKDIDHLNYLYIKENPFKYVSSTKIRRQKVNNAILDKKYQPISNTYLIRNDFHFYKDVPNTFSPIESVKHAFSKVLPNFNFETIDVEDQIQKAQEKLNHVNTPTLSLDVYLKGDYNLEISRIFRASDSQLRAKGFTKRPEYQSELLTSDILSLHKEYVLIEDDIASGQTLAFVKELIGEDSQLIDQVLLSDYSNLEDKNFFDVVDLRDFIINAPHGGLVVESHNQTFRAPYIAPFVDLVSRANIPAESVLSFSLDILNLNIQFYETLKENNISIKLNSQTKALFEHVNFNNYEEFSAIDAIINYCQIQILFLLNGVPYD